MASVKKNFIYNSILTVSGYLFPLITYPYVSRVLGVTNIGICNYVDSIITYFCMFSMMGLSIYGIREIASAKKDYKKRNEVFTSLLSLNCITTVIALVALLVSIQVIPAFQENSRLMYIGVVKLLFNSLLIEWLFKGLEDFKYITIRSLILRTVYTIGVFIFIKTSDDYWIYYLLSVVTLVINAIINIFYARHFVRLSLNNIILKPYISGFVIMGVYLIVTSLYTTFNVVYLGSVSTKTEVGYYSTAHKLYVLIIAVYTAFTNVMLPRMSSLISEGKIDEFKEYIYKSIGVLFSLAIPLVVFSCIFSEEIILILSGRGYEGAIVPMQIMMPLVLIIGYEQILVVQTLMPFKEDRIVFRNSVIGAIVGVTLNILLVKQYAAIGSSIVWISCEIVVLLLSQISVKKIVGISFPFKPLFANIIAYLPLTFAFVILHTYCDSIIVTLLLASIALSIYFVLVQLFFIKNQYIIASLSKILNHFRNGVK